MCLKVERCGGKHTFVFLHWPVTMYEVYRTALWTEGRKADSRAWSCSLEVACAMPGVAGRYILV